MPGTEKAQAIADINRDIETCTECRSLAGVGDRPVFPRGNPDAACMLVGEGPGKQEEKQQKPFVGSAGRLLEDTLRGLGFDVERDFYITNIVKYRSYRETSPGRISNKPPTVKQINTERRFLEREIEVIKPRLIVALGAKASQWFLGKDFKLTEGHGTIRTWNGIKVLPTYHPAAILRAYAVGGGEERREDFVADLRKIRDILQPGKAA